MRTKNLLFCLEDLTTLTQYLYMNENHSITFNNGMADIRLRMDERFNIMGINMNFEDLGETNWSEIMTVSKLLGLVDKLKETPPEKFDFFKNRWEEIEEITLHNIGLNKVI